MKRKQFLALILAVLMALSMNLCAVQASAASIPAATAAVGLSKEEIQRIQQQLIDLGFLEGSADGVYGNQTTNAILAFQKYAAAQGVEIAQDGLYGKQTAALLFNAAFAERRMTVQVGDSNSLVLKLQNRLIEFGFLTELADGVFGTGTETALKRFQQTLADHGVSGISANGKTDAVTREYLYKKDLAKYGIVTPSMYDANQPMNLKAGHLYAEACILMDADTGEVLYAKNADRQMYPASTTKILTLMLALERGDLSQLVVVPQAAAEVAADSSLVPVNPGEVMPYRDLLYGLMIRSGNDAANAVAVLTSGSVAQFVQKMNEKAAELGATHSHFANPHGYHDDAHYTTAKDLGLIACAMLKDGNAKKVFQTNSYTLSKTALRAELPISKTYDILNSNTSSYYPYVTGGKTGYTQKAGQCFVSMAEKGGKTLVAVVLKSGTVKTDKWTDTARLYNYGFAKLGV